MRVASCLLLMLFGIVRSAGATPYTRIALVRPHAAANDQFGFSVGALGSYVLVGAPGENVDAGAVYLFDGKTGALVREFRRPDGSPGDRFGAAVAGTGSRVLIGAPGYNQNLGATYVYDLTVAGDQGTLLSHSGGQFGDFFGSAVGVASGGLLAGAPRFKTSVNADRAGRVYRYDEAALGESFSLLRPTAKQQVEFGYSVTGAGSVIGVGAPFDNQGESGPKNGGAVYLYDAATGGFLATIFQPAPTKEDKFGFAVSSFGDKFIVGAPRDGDLRTGEAYIYDPAATSAPEHILSKPGATRGDEFGNSVTRVGPNILIGARSDDDLARDSGAAYLYDGNGAWLETFANPTPKRDDHFAWSVAAAGLNFVVGAPDDDESSTNVGQAYLYVDFVADPEDCDDADVCTLDGTPETGCGHLLIAGCCNQNSECDDGDQCNDTNRCENHACVASDPGCSDGIICTLDCSPAIGCIAPQAPPGFPGLLCWLGVLRDAMKSDLPGARGFSARLVALSATTYQRGEVAGSAPSRRALKVLKRIKKRLRRIDAVVTRVERRKKLDPAVTRRLLGYSKNARETLPALVSGLQS